MSKRVFNLVVGITGGVCAIASAIVAFAMPPYSPAILASIPVLETAIVRDLFKVCKEK